MKNVKKNATIKPRNWALVIIASLVIVLNIAIVFVGIVYASSLGWWSLVFVIGGLSSIVMASLAIKKNEPAWLLLDLILPN